MFFEGFSRFGRLWRALGERLEGSSSTLGLHLTSKMALKSGLTGPKDARKAQKHGPKSSTSTKELPQGP